MGTPPLNPDRMLKNYLLVAIRNMLRNKAVSVIHVGGLGLGIAAFLFAMQTVIFEYSFDKWHADADRIYNISMLARIQGETFDILSAVPALYHRIKSDVPEVELVSRYFSQDEREPYCMVSYHPAGGQVKSYNESNVKYADEEFLKILSFKVLRGSPDGELNKATSLVLTQSLASKYFGDEDPIGKVLEVRTGGPESRVTTFAYQVTTVLADIPSNSSIEFDMLLPFRNFEEHYIQDVSNIWFWPSFFTFIKTKNIEDPETLDR